MTGKSPNRRCIVLLVALLIALLAAPAWLPPIQGQAGAVAAVKPALAQVELGSTVVITVEVRGGENVNAFDLTLLYNPVITSLVSYEPGDYLSNLFRVYKNEQDGLLRVAYTQLATSPVSGDGTLLRLVFHGLAEGDCDLILDDLIFADASGNKSYPARENAILQVVMPVEPSATLTLPPSATVTFTLPPVATVTFTPTGTATITSTPPPTRTSLPTRTMPAAHFTPSPLAPKSSAAPENQPAAGNQPSEVQPTLPVLVTTTAPAAGQGSPWVETLLWVILAVGGAAIIIMLIILAAGSRKRTT